MRPLYAAFRRCMKSFRRSVAFVLYTVLLLQSVVFAFPNGGQEAKRPVQARGGLVSADIVISQLYGAGGNTGAVLRNDFVELFNRGAAPVTFSGWSVQYAAATGTSWQVTSISGTIQPGGYYLVQLASGGSVGSPLPTPNATGTLNLSGTAGKLALVTNTTALSCGANCLPNAAIKDFVGFGATANSWEGTGPAPAPSTTTADIRLAGGCTETDNNNTDFTTGAPAPRNSSSPVNSCGGGSTNPSGTGAANPGTVAAGGSTLLTVTVTPGTTPASTGLTVTGDLSAIGGSNSQAFFDNGTNGDATPGDNIFSYQATVAPATTAGAKTLPATIGDLEGRSGSANIALTVTSSSTPPSVAGNANPGSVAAGSSVLLTAAVTPGTNPSSTGITVTADLTAIGGSAAQAMFDDGSNGDTTAGDNVFSFDAMVALATTPGSKSLPVGVSDAQSRTANTNISLTVTAAPQTGQPLPFTQNWANTSAITANDDWSGVPGIVGYRGDNLTGSTGTDPQTIVADGSGTPVNVVANQLNPDSATSGGVAEFELSDPVVALQGSGTADAPHIVVSVDTTGQNNITVSYNLRDIDGSSDNSIQPVALQYRIGGSGSYTNVPAAYVADASDGPSDATLVTPVNVLLPAEASDKPLVQLRIITTNAVGNDEWIGIDDIVVTSGGTLPLSGVGSATPNTVNTGGSSLLKVTVNPATNPGSTGIAVVADLSPIGGSAAQQFFDDGTNGDATAGDNVFSYLAAIPQDTTTGSYSLSASITDAEARSASTSILLTVGTAVSANVHLTMGNPSGAVADESVPTNYLMIKDQYAMSYHRDRAIPNWVSWHLNSSWIGSTSRQNDFRPDPSLPAGWYQVQGNDYSGSGFDRGHLTPSGDRTASVADNSATFLMTNMMPQAPNNNQGPWEQFESYCRSVVSQGNEIYIIAGSVGTGGTGANGFATTIAGGRVTVPAYTWKVAIILPNGNNDVSRVTTSTRTIGIIMPNKQGINVDPWQKYLATVDQVEELTGHDFFSNVPTSTQAVIESRLDPASNTAPQTVSGGTYANLSIDGPNTTLTGNVTVTGTLTLGGSTLTTGVNKITLAPGATVSRISGFVNGRVEKQFGGLGSFEFPVGTGISEYTPVNVTVTALNTPGSSLTVQPFAAAHPNAPEADAAIGRYWTITESGDLVVDMVFNYLDSDIPATIPFESTLKLQRYEGAFGEIPSTIDTTANTASTTGIGQFSDWTLFGDLAPTAAGVAVSGRVLTAGGQPIGHAIVTLMNPSGEVLSARTNPFGYYQFENVPAGVTYFANVRAKDSVFSPTAVSVVDEVTGLNFVALP